MEGREKRVVGGGPILNLGVPGLGRPTEPFGPKQGGPKWEDTEMKNGLKRLRVRRLHGWGVNSPVGVVGVGRDDRFYTVVGPT